MEEARKKAATSGTAPLGLRVGRLSRLEGYLDWAILGMWALPERADTLLGMAEASLRDLDANDPDLEILETLQGLVREAREHHGDGRFAPAMARMRVAADLLGLRVILLSAGAEAEQSHAGG